MNTPTTDSIASSANHMADQAVQGAQTAIRSTQRFANSAEDMARRGVDRIVQASDRTAVAIQADPLKAVLVAAAAGAVLMALATWVGRSRDVR